ncbi:hypothetical protein [Dongshaea marina]|uniref:hypothetical protein n=1 Tax=Dongshaea marina TaxID=2047966 RepID=UPI000D3E6A36|nr:hypothetical protein [Dongshaea marina]
MHINQLTELAINCTAELSEELGELSPQEAVTVLLQMALMAADDGRDMPALLGKFQEAAWPTTRAAAKDNEEAVWMLLASAAGGFNSLVKGS